MLRVLFWPVDQHWTIYFDNSGLGTDADAVMPVLSQRLAVDAVRVVMSQDLRDSSTGQIQSYPATIFEYYRAGLEQRHVYAANDGGKWRFGAAGDPFPFEDLQRYGTQPLRNRFTHEMLLAYLNALGISLDGVSEAAHKYGPGYTMRKLGRLPLNLREC